MKKEEIVSKPLFRVLLSMGIPSVLGMMIIGLNTFIDAIYVGRLLGEMALAGISIVFPLTSVTLGLGSLIGSGGASLLSLYIGEGDVYKQKSLLPNVLALGGMVSLTAMVLSYPFSTSILALMGGSGEFLALGDAYFKVLILGLPFLVTAVSLNLMIRGEGRMVSAMTFAAIAMATNIVLNPVFIAVFDWGIAGAAWSTNVSMMVYSGLNFGYYALKKPSFPVSFSIQSIAVPELKRILKIGFPQLTISVMQTIQQLFVFRSLAAYGGPQDIAFFGAMGRLAFMAFLPMMGLVRASQPIFGINYGARQYSRVRGFLVLFNSVGVAMEIVLIGILMMFPSLFVSFVLPGIVLSGQMVFLYRLYLSLLLVVPVILIVLTCFQSIARPLPAAVLVVMRQVGLFIPLVLYLGMKLGVTGVYYALFLVDIIVVFIVLGMWRWIVCHLRYLERRI